MVKSNHSVFLTPKAEGVIPATGLVIGKYEIPKTDYAIADGVFASELLGSASGAFDISSVVKSTLGALDVSNAVFSSGSESYLSSIKQSVTDALHVSGLGNILNTSSVSAVKLPDLDVLGSLEIKCSSNIISNLMDAIKATGNMLYMPNLAKASISKYEIPKTDYAIADGVFTSELLGSASGAFDISSVVKSTLGALDVSNAVFSSGSESYLSSIKQSVTDALQVSDLPQPLLGTFEMPRMSHWVPSGIGTFKLDKPISHQLQIPSLSEPLPAMLVSLHPYRPLYEITLPAVPQEEQEEEPDGSLSVERALSDLVFKGELYNMEGVNKARGIISDIGKPRLHSLINGLVQVAGIAISDGFLRPTEAQLMQSDDGIIVVRLSPGLSGHAMCKPKDFSQTVSEAIRKAGYEFERYPKRFKHMGEDELRDTLLNMLNFGYGMGGDAEAIQGCGKTDIKIVNRLDPHEVIIVECKLWTGKDNYNKAMNQLLSYQTGREKNCILLCFAKNAHFSNISNNAQSVIRSRQDFISESIVSIQNNSNIHSLDWLSRINYTGSCSINVYHLFFNLFWQ